MSLRNRKLNTIAPLADRLALIASGFVRFLDDILVLAGCGLVLYGCWVNWPVSVPFVAGALCVAWGLMIGRAGSSK